MYSTANYNWQSVLEHPKSQDCDEWFPALERESPYQGQEYQQDFTAWLLWPAYTYSQNGILSTEVFCAIPDLTCF